MEIRENFDKGLYFRTFELGDKVIPFLKQILKLAIFLRVEIHFYDFINFMLKDKTYFQYKS